MIPAAARYTEVMPTNQHAAARELYEAIRGAISTDADFEVYGTQNDEDGGDDWVIVNLSAAEALDLAEVLRELRQPQRQEIPGQLPLFV